ncbi:MAG: FtsQ-type POTRA domain-containing protein [Desulfatibacillum sp.]|nr:FtsQ-type POTRA domain-containing protein [Desulfatibacillum sp.]
MLVRKKVRKNRYKKSTAPTKFRYKKLLLRCLVGAGSLASLALFAVFAILIYDVFTQSPYFEAKDIEIQGASRLAAHEILQQAKLELGANILSVSLKTVQDSLVAHPWIAKARVRRNLPNSMTISVTEREAIAVLDLGERFLMDTRGEIFKRCDASDPKDLPVVTGLKFSDISVSGEKMSRAYKSVLEFLQVRKEYEWALPCSAIAGIQVDRDMGLTLVSSEPAFAVRFGYDDYAEKFMRLNQVLLKCSKEQGIQVVLIDIVDVDRVVVRPREEV